MVTFQDISRAEWLLVALLLGLAGVLWIAERMGRES